MTYKALNKAAHTLQLDIVGAFHPTIGQSKTLLLLGPCEPGFWAHFTASDEYSDGQPDPLDRWTKRVVSPWADTLEAQAVFPSDGPPYPPFFEWAKQSGQSWQSPVGLLAHHSAGLLISFRAAIVLPRHVDLPDRGDNPCITCTSQPCITACPVAALTAGGYDVPKCKTYLNTGAGRDCMQSGCLVRSTCPVSQKYGRVAEQSAFHMAAFNPK